MKIRRLISFLFFVFSVSIGVSQTFNTTGDWNTAANWSTNPTIPSGTGTNVTIANNATISSPNSNTIGNVTVNNNTTITINSGGTLTLGSSSLFPTTKKNLTFSNSGTLTVSGTLYIYGDLVVNNSLALNITGTVIVYGNVTMSNGGSLSVSGSGSLQVGGNIAGGNNTQISTSGSGTIAVTGSISTGGGSSSITGGAGTITAGGGCSLNGASCGSTVTPVELIFFKSVRSANAVELIWATESELNFDYFIVEHSTDGILFSSIAKLQGHGTTNERHDYQFIDDLPFVGKNYYRLKSVDFDGYTEYFDVLLVSFDGDKQFQLSPNPSDGSNIVAKTNFIVAEKGSVIVYDNVGSVVGRFELEGNEFELNFSDRLKAGTYFAKFSSDGFTKVARFLVKE